jgi:hypothetical protein
MLSFMVTRVLYAVCTVSAFLLISGAAPAQSADQSAPPAQPTQNAPGQTQSTAPKLQLENLPPDSHTLTPAEEAQAREQQALTAAVRLASIQAQWGAGMSTPGLSMSLVEVGRTKSTDGATEFTYHVTASGFTPGDTLSLIRWPLNEQAHKIISGLTLTPEGLAVCGAQASTPSAPSTAPSGPSAPSCTTTMKPNDPLAITATAAPGEPIRVALIDDDRSRGAAATLVPFPLANEDQNCKLQVLLGIRDASMVLVEGTGFPPRTPLKVDSTTGTHTRTLHPVTNADGYFVTLDLPETNGQAAGTTTVRFAGVNHQPTLEDTKAAKPDPTCAPSVTFPWGKGTYKVQ